MSVIPAASGTTTPRQPLVEVITFAEWNAFLVSGTPTVAIR